MMKAGRNEPCPCGSGKKFKHCHGGAGRAAAPTADAAWDRLRRAINGYPTRMLRFIDEVYGPEAVREAWDEFNLWESDDPEFDPESPHVDVFLPWFFHHWCPAATETSIGDSSLHDRSPTSVFLERRRRGLDPILVRYLTACLESPFSFYEVLRSEPGRRIWTRDFFTGTTCEVFDRSASRAVQPGDTMFGQLVTAEGITLIEGCGRYVIPPRDKLILIEFRQRINQGRPLEYDDLKEWDIEIREEYLDLVDSIENQPPRLLQNTDGEQVVFHRMFFTIDSPARAFAALKDLASGESDPDLLEGAELDGDGQVRRVTFAWTIAGNAVHRSWENTVLGHIEIDRTELRAEVNSAERAARLREIIEGHLGESVRHERTEIESVEDAISRERAAAGGTDSEPDALLNADSEVQERIREMLAAHYDGWVSEPLPILNGLTPREAVEDRVGRQKVEVLLTELERGMPMAGQPLHSSIVTDLRTRLGLTGPEDPPDERPQPRIVPE